MLRQAPVQFEAALDVPLGGVLWALPALLTEGLLRHSRKLFALPEGFYPLETIFLVLAFMALLRVRSLEALRYEPPGEWGRLVGLLDRIPEVRTLRQKLGHLCQPAGAASTWSQELAKQWLAAQPDHDGVYYADGHVRVYHGKLTALPRRYVARQKLCLRGTTDYWVNALDGRPFARWTQENFLKYMREHYAIDRLVEHGIEPLPESTPVVNPAWRRLDSQIRREQSLRERDRAAFGALCLSAAPQPPELEAWQQQKARLYQTLTLRETQLSELKAKRKETPRHVPLKDLPKEEPFPRLRAQRKHFVDTIKLIAYRAETALVGTVREALQRHDDGRALVRELLRTPADLQPDLQAKTLTVRLHPLPSRLQDTAVRHLAEELTATETNFPGTDLRLIFALNGPP
jgi:hypothetical protein